MMRTEHITDEGKFQSDKYPWCSPGFVPLKLTDPMAQKLLWEYSVTRSEADKQFADDLQWCLLEAGFEPTLKKGE